MAGKQLTPEEIRNLIAGIGTRGKKKDSTEPRTENNWWRQTHRFIYRPDYPDLDVKCSNPDCGDPRPYDKGILLAEVKDTLMCRYCFLSGYLSE